MRAAGAVASRSRAPQPGQRGRYRGDLRPGYMAAPEARPASMARAQGPRHGTTTVQNRNQQHPVGPPQEDARRGDATTPSHTGDNAHWHLARFRHAA
eukprot:6227525-Pyramimonas_sp.AAC.1